jgi:hypothetical protein
MKKLYWLLAVLVLVGLFMDRLWTYSVDLAHHYALVARLAEHFTMPGVADNSLGEMNYYPRGSHFVAAMLGMLTGSNLLGIHLLSILALVAIWGGFIYLLLRLPNPARWWALPTMLVLLGLNKWLNILQVHGNELIGNYFFAQMVAQAGLVLIIIAAYLCETSATTTWRRNLLIIVMAWVLAFVHLLPVVELLGLFGFLLLQDFLARRSVAKGVGLLVVLMLATWVVVRHPNFAAMLSISKSDGDFLMKSAHSVRTVGIYSLLVVLLAAPLWWRWQQMNEEQRKQWLVWKYLVFYSMAVAIIALMQWFALQLGHGSPYAVRKYMFSVETALLLEMCLAFAWYATRFSPGKIVAPAHGVAALGVVCALVTIMPSSRGFDTSDLVNLERDLRTLERTVIPAQPNKYTYVTDLLRPDGSPWPSIIPYMFSLGVFKVPRSTMVNDILADKKITRMGSAGILVSSQGSRIDAWPKCHNPPTRYGLVLIDTQCWARESGTSGIYYELSQQHKDWPCTLTGIGEPEPIGRWTIQKKATIVCTVPRLNDGFPKKMLLNATAFLQRIPQQRVEIVQNGGAPQHYQFHPGMANQIMSVPLQVDAKGQIRIELNLPDARTPTSLGVGHDLRELGVSIQSLDFQ